MNRTSILLVVAAVALTACSSDPVSPIAASATRGIAAAQHTPTLPLHGTFDGVETGVFQPATNTVLLTVLGSGNASQLGRYSSKAELTLDLPSGTTIGVITVTAADGSTISATVTGVGLATNGISTIVETATITGGTGRFANARGSFRIERTLNQGTGTSSGSISGSITVNR